MNHPTNHPFSSFCSGPVWRKGEDDKDEEEEDDEEEDQDEGHEQWLHLDSPSRDGCSGGPVMCARGVIGVVAQAALQITASVSTESVHEVLKRWLGIPLEVNTLLPRRILKIGYCSIFYLRTSIFYLFRMTGVCRRSSIHYCDRALTAATSLWSQAVNCEL